MATASWRNVETYGSSIPRIARRLRLWKTPEPDAGGGRPQDAAHARDTGAIFWPFACSIVPPK